MEDKITEIETMLAYQQKVIDELNEVVSEQTKDIMSLKNRLNATQKSLEEANSRIKDIEDETPPPHY